jgi:hypothetical protein
MHKYYFNVKWQPTRSQIIASYRLSANKHLADLLSGPRLQVGATSGLYNPDSRQQLRELDRFKRITR